MDRALDLISSVPPPQVFEKLPTHIYIGYHPLLTKERIVRKTIVAAFLALVFPPLLFAQHNHAQLLWDFTQKPQQPTLPEGLKARIIQQIRPITHTADQVVFTAVVHGAFYPGLAANTQMAITAVQYSVDRSQVEGPWSFLIIDTNGSLELFQNPYGDSALKSFRPAGAAADYLLADASGGEQGESDHYLRVISVANHSVQLVQAIGIADVSDCAAVPPHGEVADRIYYDASPSGFTIQPRQHFYRPCAKNGAFRKLASNSKDAEQAFLSLPSFSQQTSGMQTPAQVGTNKNSTATGWKGGSNANSASSCAFVPLPNSPDKRTQFAVAMTHMMDKQFGEAAFVVSAYQDQNRTLMIASAHKDALLKLSSVFAQNNASAKRARANVCIQGFTKIRFVLASVNDGQISGVSILNEVHLDLSEALGIHN